MAQRNRIVRQTKALARRFGLAGGRPVAVVGALLLAVAVGVGIVANTHSYVMVERDDEAAEQVTTSDYEQLATQEQDVPDAEHKELVVHVDGAVADPGVYVVEGEAPRINDAVLLAGGLLPDADTSSINLAQPLSDGQKVHVPAVGEQVVQPGAQDVPLPDAPASAQEATAGSKINVNSATVDELQKLPGVGEATAASIVDDRERNGPFLSVEDLMRVSGIGEKKFEKMRDLIDV